MANLVVGLLHGMVLETTAESWTGEYLYSDFSTSAQRKGCEKDTTLNGLVKIPLLGNVAAVGRIALGIIHVIGHLLAAAVTFNKGHLFHASKGVCEIFRGVIEAIPLIGRIFANFYNSIPIEMSEARCWWMIKIYNPNKPDGLDHYMNQWKGFSPTFYVKA
jgi:hypothetical protein